MPVARRLMSGPWSPAWIMTILLLAGFSELQAQEERVVSSRAAAAPAPASATPQQPNAGGENAEKKDGENGEKKDGESSEGSEKKEGDDSGAPTAVKRDTATEQANPINTEVKWADDGAVQFSFHNQPWKIVLQWIADASKLSFDWQELPGDALNLTTTRSYKLEEARDLLNRHLLSRGYTMLVHGEILSVVKLGDLKASLVPRVKPEQLNDLPEHSIVKVSFNLDWLIAEEAATELQPMLTDAGRINKLSRTNRLEVIDTAGSLRDIWNILQDEQSDDGQEQLIKTFQLKHRRASDVITLLRPLVGLDNPSTGGPTTGMDPRMMQQAMQQMQKMMQQAQKNQAGGAGKKEMETRLVLNNRENMIIAQAAPDQMAIIEKAIDAIDVERNAGSSLNKSLFRLQVYRLQTIDPQTLVDLLKELGDLDPGTMLKVGKDKKTIMAWADLADHLTIKQLVERVDSSGRELEVIRLRRLEAEYVAGTIMTLMGPKEKEDNSSRYDYFGFYGYGRRNQQEESTDSFRVDADLQGNQLLVYANPVEMDEIRRLLQKLGELPDPDARDPGYRVFELNPEDDPAAIMRQLQELWRRKNKLELNVPEQKPDEKAGTDNDTAARSVRSGRSTLVGYQEDDSSQPAPEEAVSAESTESAVSPATSAEVEEFFQEAKAASEGKNPNDGAPVKISVAEDGRLIVACDDPVALAEIEDMMRFVAKPTQSFRIYTMKYQSPYWVALTLEEYFELEEDDDDGGYRGYYYYRYGPGSRDNKKSLSLSERRIPQFIWDDYTSTILVKDADARQLQTIEELIKIYDAPSPADTRSMRVQEIFRMKNARAEVVAQAIKDVFRDLLSSNDKALEKPGGEQKQQSSRGYSYFDYGGGGGDEEDDPVKFKGLLSIGIDQGSNTLIVSAQQRLMPTIKSMVEELDKAAERSSGVRILELDPSVDLGLIQDRLSKMLGPNRGAQPNQNGQQNPNGRPTPEQMQQMQQAAAAAGNG